MVCGERFCFCRILLWHVPVNKATWPIEFVSQLSRDCNFLWGLCVNTIISSNEERRLANDSIDASREQLVIEGQGRITCGWGYLRIDCVPWFQTCLNPLVTSRHCRKHGICEAQPLEEMCLCCFTEPYLLPSCLYSSHSPMFLLLLITCM